MFLPDGWALHIMPSLEATSKHFERNARQVLAVAGY